MSSDDELPLPYGWVREVDPRTNHPFYVDTKADPPRAIWVHPYEDEQYLSEHPDVREKVGNMIKEHEAKQSRPASSTRRHSFHGTDSPSMANGNTTMAVVASSKDKKHKRGFFGKMKDKAIGTKEEREAYKREMDRQDRERRKQLEEMRAESLRQRQAYYQQQQQYYQQHPNQQYYGPYAGPSSSRYGPPPGDPYANGGWGAQPQRGFGGGGGGFGGVGLPMLGALAGGLLLGDLLF